MADDARKTQLIEELARHRAALTVHTHTLRRDLDFGARFQASFRKYHLVWISGAALLGLLLTWSPRRKKKVIVPSWKKPAPEVKAVQAGLLITVLKIGFDLIRPALTKWVTSQVTVYAADRFSGRSRR